MLLFHSLASGNQNEYNGLLDATEEHNQEYGNAIYCFSEYLAFLNLPLAESAIISTLPSYYLRVRVVVTHGDSRHDEH